jgi:hypothetical protein
MAVRRVAQVFGVVFLLVGILGFVPGVAQGGMLLGLFPVNILHNLVHLVFGAWGLAASKSFGGAKAYCQIAGVIYILLAVVGKIEPEPLGLVPIGGNDVWLHAGLGVVLSLVGFTAKDSAA